MGYSLILQILSLRGKKALAMSGAQGDYTMLADYVEANVHFQQMRTGLEMSTAATAHWLRTYVRGGGRKLGQATMYTSIIAYTYRLPLNSLS